MEYEGKLFGKVGTKYIPLRMSSVDVDELLEALEACMKIIGPPDALASECWATTDEINAAWDKGAAAIAKAKGETK
jgi:hypothetical protein